MGKLNIIVDGNYHFHKSLHVYPHQGKEPKLKDEKDRNMFMRKIAMDMAYGIRQLGKPDRVIFTIDHHSWRKDVDIEENEGYKANRVKDESVVDWKAFNKCLADFGEILKSHGCITSNIDSCEGDDLMYYWANKLFDDGEDVVIMTGDGDISQLVKHSGNNFIVVYNIKSTDRKIIAAPGFFDFLHKINEVSLFDADSFMGNNKDAIKEVIANSALQELDPEDVLFSKILMGDGGDNVPPIVSWQTTQKSGKVINNKMTDKAAARIKELLLARGKIVDVTHLEEHAKEISNEIKIIYNKEFDSELIKKRIIRNTILVYLSDDTIPSKCRKLFEEHYLNVRSGGYPRLGKWDMHTLLANSEYEIESMSFEADVFKNLGGKTKPKAANKPMADKPIPNVGDLLAKTLF
ncbi:MAG: hypothetical protein WC979_00970 [Candidatus Pacearchaeota archaeon]